MIDVASLPYPSPDVTPSAENGLPGANLDLDFIDYPTGWAIPRRPHNPRRWRMKYADYVYPLGVGREGTWPPRIGSLFSGYGGLDMGVMAALGGSVAWHVEFDKAPSKILAHHWPDVPNYGDVTAVDWSQVEPVDVITGGSPCQDLSHAGKRAGMTEGTRSNLWVAMREAIAALRPSLVVWENVRGAYSAAADSELESNARLLADTRRRDGEPVLRALGRVLGDLSDLGYDCRWHGLRAADVGAPHGRFRVFVVAYPSGGGRNGWAQTSIRSAFGRTPTAGSGALLPTPRATRGGSNTETTNLLPTPRATDGTKGGPNQRGSSGDLMLPSAVTLLPTPTAQDASASGGSTWSDVTLTDATVRTRMGTQPNERLLPTPRALDATNVCGVTPNRSDEDNARAGITLHDISRDDRWGIYADAIARWETITRPAPAPTQPSKKGTPQLAPAFSEWMMGLPAGWVTDVPGLSRNDQLKALGNGVVPQQAEAALRFLLSVQAVAA